MNTSCLMTENTAKQSKIFLAYCIYNSVVENFLLRLEYIQKISESTFMVRWSNKYFILNWYKAMREYWKSINTIRPKMYVQLVYNQKTAQWWRHQVETVPPLLALCAGKSPVTGEFPTHRPVTRNIEVLFDLHLNKRLSKQSLDWWFETPSRPSWRHWMTTLPYNYSMGYNVLTPRDFIGSLHTLTAPTMCYANVLTQDIPLYFLLMILYFLSW